MMKSAFLILLGLIVGLVAGYFLHASLAAPLGSSIHESRVLTSDLSLDQAHYFADKPPVSGTIRKGSQVAVEWRKSSAAYISFNTVVPYDRLVGISKPAPAQ